MVTSLGPTSCFYWASKLLCGTFWAGLKSLKTSAAAFEGLITSQPLRRSFRRLAACLAMVNLPRPHKLFLLGFETAMWHVIGQASKASKPPQQLSKALEPHNPPQQLSKACRLLGHGNLPRPHELFLLGFETAMWHVLGRPQKLQNLRSKLSKALEPQQPSAAPFEGVPLCLAMVPS